RRFDFLAAILGIDVKPVRRLADDAALAAHDGEAEERHLALGEIPRMRLIAGEDVVRLLLLAGGAGAARLRLLEPWIGACLLPALADEPGQLGDVEIAVAVEADRCDRAVLEGDERGEIAFR